MDPQLQEAAKQIADAVERRLVARLSDRFDAFEERLESRFGTFEHRVDGLVAMRLGEAETRLAEGAKAHAEELRDLVKLAAEGYGATLESIDRRLDRLEKKVDNGFADQARVLRQHTSEINTVKYQLAPRRSPRK